jgi:hypothetical protein
MGQYNYEVFLLHRLSGRTPFWIRSKYFGFRKAHCAGGPVGLFHYKNFTLANLKL